MRIKNLLSSGLLLSASVMAFNAPVKAQIPVTDVASIAQQIVDELHQLANLSDNIQRNLALIDQLEQDFLNALAVGDFTAIQAIQDIIDDLLTLAEAEILFPEVFDIDLENATDEEFAEALEKSGFKGLDVDPDKVDTDLSDAGVEETARERIRQNTERFSRERLSVLNKFRIAEREIAVREDVKEQIDDLTQMSDELGENALASSSQLNGEIALLEANQNERIISLLVEMQVIEAEKELKLLEQEAERLEQERLNLKSQQRISDIISAPLTLDQYLGKSKPSASNSAKPTNN